MAYCASRFRTLRRVTREVRVGSVGVGGSNPIRVQSMTTSDTQDIAATVRQSIALAEVGCEIVRITAPNVQAARCLREIRAQFTAAGFGAIPLVADIHFLPAAAMEAVEHVEKVRVNPGNYADKKKFAVREYSDADYDRELQRLHEAFSPLVRRCKELGRAMRIGTNHGSLSDRIMNRYGDTPLGMVESALEFLRICESHEYRSIVLSMKASNPKVMIEAYRLLVERMQQENMFYPLHLGVTEAGDGEDGRIKSAIGIGSLLLDGLGDTIRVSLTEDSVYEIPVAQALAARAGRRFAAAGAPAAAETDGIDPFHFARRDSAPVPLAPALAAGGPDNVPRVVVRTTLPELSARDSAWYDPRRADTPAEVALVAVGSDAERDALMSALPTLPAGAVIAELAPGIGLPASAPAGPGFAVLRRYRPADAAALAADAAAAERAGYSLCCDISAAAVPALAAARRAAPAARLIVTSSAAHDADTASAWERRPAALSSAAAGEPVALSSAAAGARAPTDAAAEGASERRPASEAEPEHPLGRYRRLAAALREAGLDCPIWIRATTGNALRAEPSFLSRLLEASILAGGLLADGIGDLLSVETEPDTGRAIRLAYNVLQGAGARISKTEFVACPSCGRTLFDLQTTTQRIRAQTGHLKGVKLAIMGCIVNGPGEMADADFGYVGGAPGKINLYVGKQCVQYNVPQAEADARLIALIKEHGRWTEPGPSAAPETVSKFSDAVTVS